MDAVEAATMTGNGTPRPERNQEPRRSVGAKYAAQARHLAARLERLAVTLEAAPLSSQEFQEARSEVLRYVAKPTGWSPTRAARMHVLEGLDVCARNLALVCHSRAMARNRQGLPPDEIDAVLPLLRLNAADKHFLQEVSDIWRGPNAFARKTTERMSRGIVGATRNRILADATAATGKRSALGVRRLAETLDEWGRQGGARTSKHAPKKWELLATLMDDLGLKERKPIGARGLQADWGAWTKLKRSDL